MDLVTKPDINTGPQPSHRQLQTIRMFALKRCDLWSLLLEEPLLC